MFIEKYKSYLYSKYGSPEFICFNKSSNPKKSTILGKRKLVDAFGDKIYNDNDRYGQDITSEFFKKNIGHSVRIK